MGFFIYAVCAVNTVDLCVAEVIVECPVLMRRTAPLQRHRDVPILSNDSLKTNVILVFAERLLLAINGHRRVRWKCPLSG